VIQNEKLFLIQRYNYGSKIKIKNKNTLYDNHVSCCGLWNEISIRSQYIFFNRKDGNQVGKKILNGCLE